MILAALRVSLVAMTLSGCAALSGAAGVASAVYTIAAQVNDDLKITAALVCGAWGGYYALERGGQVETPPKLTGFREDLAVFCSGDSAIGDTPLETLADLWGKAKALHAAAG